MKTNELVKGDILQSEVDGIKYVFIGAMPHPMYDNLVLVIWWKWERGYVLDALAPTQELPFSKTFRYSKPDDIRQVMSLALQTWQQSGLSLRG